MWTKGRLVQQQNDTTMFNQKYPDFLKTSRLSGILVQFGHLYHGLTKKTAIHEQKIKPSAVVQNWLHFEEAKLKTDEKRPLEYKQNTWIHSGGINIIRDKQGNCNTMAAALLGQNPVVASIGNMGTFKGTHVMTPMKQGRLELETQQFNHMPSNSGKFGFLKNQVIIYNLEHHRITKINSGCGVVYDESIQDFFESYNTNKTKYVWGAVITNSDNNQLLPQSKWQYGWISYSNINKVYDDHQIIKGILNISGTELDKKQNADHDIRKDTYPHVEYGEPFDQDKYELHNDRQKVFEEGKKFKLGSHIATVQNGKIEWNSKIFPLKDYKGHDILIPDERMYGWLEQRRIYKINVESGKNKVGKTVVFGTSHDKYAMYPDKYGFMSRKDIKKTLSWIPEYDEIKRALNPPITMVPKFFRKQYIFPTKKRRNEVYEKSALQIEHSPNILMKNSYLKTHDDFIYAYLSGSKHQENQANLADDIHISGADHITDHEIYRLFTCDNRIDQLSSCCFADDNLLIEAPTRPDNHWYNKNQVTRAYKHRVGVAS